MKQKAKKRKILKFELLSLDYQEVSEVYDECETAFKSYFFDPRVEEQIEEQEKKSIKKENNKNQQKESLRTSDEKCLEKKEHEKAEVEEEIVNGKSKKIVRKLFKAIALETHPDKLYGKSKEEIEDKEELYKKAARAARRNDEHELLEIAVYLGITDILDDSEIFLLLDKSMMNIKNKVSQMKNSVFWIWYHSTGKEKEKLEKYIEKQFGLKKRG